MVTYRFARCSDGRIVDVMDLDDVSRRVLAPFECLGCGNTLIAKLPEKGISKYFSHKHQGHCGFETYLHKFAKEQFASAYNKALYDGSPFLLSRVLNYTCKFYEKLSSGTCDRQLFEEFDLTKFFTKCSIEKMVQSFVGDVVLSSSDETDFLLVEFAVSHRCTEDKLSSGLRIAEIKLANEADVLDVCGRLDGRRDNVRLYNFRKREFPKVSCEGKCDKVAVVLLVYQNGKARLVDLKPHELLSYSPPEYVIHHRGVGLYEEEVLDIERGYIFQEAVRAAHLDGVPIRNCFNCKYHGTSFEAGVFCRIEKKELGSNSAAECKKYQTLRTKEEYEALDRNNEEFIYNAPTGYVVNRMFKSGYL